MASHQAIRASRAKPLSARSSTFTRGPAFADLGDDPGDLLHRAGAGVDVRAPQPGGQQVVAAENVERQVAVAIVVAMEETPLLMAVDRIVRGVQVERDPRRWLGMGVQEQVDEQPLDRRGIVGDLAVAVPVGGRVLQAVQRALARQRRAGGPPGLQPAQHRPKHRIAAQVVVVGHVLVAKRDGEHALADQGRHVVDDALRRPAVVEAAGKALGQIDRLVRRAQQQRAGVRGHRPATEIRNHLAAIEACKQHRFRVTLCRHRGLLCDRGKCLLYTHTFADFRPRCT